MRYLSSKAETTASEDALCSMRLAMAHKMLNICNPVVFLI